MEHIEVTPEMRQRILKHIQQTDLTKRVPQKIIPFPHIRRFAVLAACLALVLVGALTIPGLLPSAQPPQPTDVALLGPFGITELPDAQALSAALGFEVEDVEGLPFAVESATYSAFGSSMAQINYEGEGQSATCRKAPGTEDISGDYNVYEAQTELSAKGAAVVLKGSGGAYTLATWTDGEYAYSISLSTGLTVEEWEDLLAR